MKPRPILIPSSPTLSKHLDHYTSTRLYRSPLVIAETVRLAFSFNLLLIGGLLQGHHTIEGKLLGLREAIIVRGLSKNNTD